MRIAPALLCAVLPLLAAAAFKPYVTLSVKPSNVVVTESAEATIRIFMPQQFARNPSIVANFIPEGTSLTMERAQVSLDGERWETVFAKKAGETRPIAFEKPVTARYVKVTVTAVDKGYFASIRDVYASLDPIPSTSSSYYRVCDKYRLRWLDVPYEPGELKVVAYTNGKRLGEETMRTAGDPAALKLTVEPKYSDDADELIWVQIDALDAKGVRNPLAMNRLQFRLEGNGTILGVGNGNAHAFEAFTETATHPLFYGKAVAVIRRDASGPLSLTVTSEGLTAATVTLP